MGPTGIFSTSAFAVLAFTTTTALAAASKTTSTTTSLILPSITTSANERIYATLISGGEDQDVYSLDCQSDFKASRTCSGAFAGRTLTYGPATVRIDLGAPQGTYDCARGGPADADTGPLTCRASAGGAGGGTFSATATLDDASRATPVTVLGEMGKARSKARTRTTTITTDGRTVTSTIAPVETSTTKPKPTAAAGGFCKRDLHPRKVGNHGSGGGDASTGSDAGSGAAGSAGTVKPDGEDDGDDGTTASGSRRKDGGGCSAGSRVDGVEWLGGLLGLGVLVLAFTI